MPGCEISGSRLCNIDDNVGGGTQAGAHLRDIVRRERGFTAQRHGGLGAGVADDEIGFDPDPLPVAQHRHAVDAAIGRVDLDRRRRQPDVAVAFDGCPERIPDPDRALRAKAETFEGALAGEIGQEGAGRQFGGVAGEDRRAQVTEDRMHRGVIGVGLEPVFGRLPPIREVAGAGVGKFLQDARGLFCELAEQQRPAAAADIDQLAVDEEGTGGLGRADIERRADGIESLLEHTAEFDGDGADIDGEAVDLLGRGTTADPVLVIDDDGMKPGMRQPRGGAQPAGAGPDHDSIRLNDRHSTSQSALPVDPDWP